MLWCLFGLLSFLLDESNVAVLPFLPRDHRSLRNYVGDSDVEASRVLLVALSPRLPGMPAYPTVTRLINLNSVRTTRYKEKSEYEPFHIIVGIIGSRSSHRFP